MPEAGLKCATAGACVRLYAGATGVCHLKCACLHVLQHKETRIYPCVRGESEGRGEEGGLGEGDGRIARTSAEYSVAAAATNCQAERRRGGKGWGRVGKG